MTSVGITFWLALCVPVELERGVFETRQRRFDLPLTMDAEQLKKCERFRLWVSEDRGKTWKRYREIEAIAEKPSPARPLSPPQRVQTRPPDGGDAEPRMLWMGNTAMMRFAFSAPHDGQYWLAVQTVFKDGKIEPAKMDDTTVMLKLFVNTLGRPIIRK